MYTISMQLAKVGGRRLLWRGEEYYNGIQTHPSVQTATKLCQL